METKREGQEHSIYTIKYKGDLYDFNQEELVLPVGFWAANYARYIHKGAEPHKFSLFWTPE
ncbi:hypothetical protein L873DRAFT_1775055 [Choiromyces venosus 120613-1]|uniref:Uncharacterized protein n=1 Tax=Choiromyces venosus 120613-1 TaxID=1336337 RepID=A0A3N4JFH0_9PEZI|nr:hypothetical protein L873DRAFT_1775055 [Choiromyces venosus 120613-1]